MQRSPPYNDRNYHQQRNHAGDNKTSRLGFLLRGDRLQFLGHRTWWLNWWMLRRLGQRPWRINWRMKTRGDFGNRPSVPRVATKTAAQNVLEQRRQVLRQDWVGLLRLERGQ